MKHSVRAVTVTFMSTLYLLPFTSQMDVHSLVSAMFFGDHFDSCSTFGHLPVFSLFIVFSTCPEVRK